KVLAHLDEARPLSPLVALVTALAMWHAKRFAPKVPPLLTGLAAGTVLSYGFSAVGLAASLGTALGAAPHSWDVATATPAAMLELARHPQLGDILPTLATSALSLALVASIDALLCARLLAMPGGDGQLVRLGLGNMAAACAGGITSGFNLGPSLANRAFGGRTRTSVLVNAGVTLLTLAAAMPLVAHLPRAVLSGAIVVIAIQAIDPWTVKAIRQLAARDVIDWKRAAGDVAVSLLVAALAIVADIVIAVMVGLTLAIGFFLVRISRPIVRRSRRGDAVRSRRMRDPRLMELLAEHGGRIVMIELEGAMFFGTAEPLVAHN